MHRKIIDHWIMRKPEYLHAWIIILLTVNHAHKKVLVHGEIIECNRGQSILSLNSWTNKFGNKWTVQKVRTFFDLLSNDCMIHVEGLRKTTRLTVCNYDSYQSEQHTDNTQITHKQHTDNTQVTTNNNDNNDNNENKESEEEKLKEKFLSYKRHLLSETVVDRLSMNAPVKIAKQHSFMVMNEFIETCYGDIIEKRTKQQAEQYFINWVKKENRVNEAISNQIRKNGIRNGQNTAPSN